MSNLNKKELKRHLKALGIMVINGNYVRKKDIINSVVNNMDSKKIDLFQKNKLLDDILNIPMVEFHKLIKDEHMGNITRADTIYQKFIQFVASALLSDPTVYKTWEEAWEYFTDTFDVNTL